MIVTMRYANVFKITKEIQGSRRTKEINLNTKLFVYVANAKRHNATRLRQHEYLSYKFEFFYNKLQSYLPCTSREKSDFAFRHAY
jgi:hypothetical protein